MNSVRSVKNQYRGINAHLHSYWQVYGWNNFHNAHISQLAGALRKPLLPMGDTTDIEDSLQMRRGDEYIRHPKSDITIYDLQSSRRAEASIGARTELSGLVVPLTAVIEDNPISEKPYRALLIYEQERKRGEPVVWIEVLSPSNKHQGDDNREYLRKRHSILESGTVFIEIDYLHELPPTLAHIPDYGEPNGQPTEQKHPYRIVVLEPRPHMENGLASINEFDVDQPIPEVVIPLSGEDFLKFDFEAPYTKQYEEMLYGMDEVDYAQFPLNFERYSEADRARIANRMLAVLKAAKAGADLEASAPLGVEEMPLETALGEIEGLGVIKT